MFGSGVRGKINVWDISGIGTRDYRKLKGKVC